jgi:hypothetical protein
MPHYFVERVCPGSPSIPINAQDAKVVRAVIAANAANAADGVTWTRSYVTPDKKKTFCIYESPKRESTSGVAQRAGPWVDRITKVCGFDRCPVRWI